MQFLRHKCSFLLQPCTTPQPGAIRPFCSYLPVRPVERIPNASDTLIHALHRLRDPLQLLTAGIPQKHCFLQDLILFQVSHADGLLATVDVVALDDWVLVRSRGDGDFDLRVLFGELREGILEEQAASDIRLRPDGWAQRSRTSCPWSCLPSRSNCGWISMVSRDVREASHT